MIATRTVFLDRDGVINKLLVDDWVTRWRDFEILDGALAAIAHLNRSGYRTVVVTNQRGIALGRMSADRVAKIHRRLSREAAALGASLNEFYVCPHDSQAGCPCRKPMPGLLDQAHQHQPVDWQGSVMVGDKDTDIVAGTARGLTTIKVAGPSQAHPDFTVANLTEAARIIAGDT